MATAVMNATTSIIVGQSAGPTPYSCSRTRRPATKRERHPGREADERRRRAVAGGADEHVPARRAEREANAELAPTLGHGGRHRSVDAEGRQQHRGEREARDRRGVEAGRAERSADHVSIGRTGERGMSGSSSRSAVWIAGASDGASAARADDEVARLVADPRLLRFRRVDAGTWRNRSASSRTSPTTPTISTSSGVPRSIVRCWPIGFAVAEVRARQRFVDGDDGRRAVDVSPIERRVRRRAAFHRVEVVGPDDPQLRKRG